MLLLNDGISTLWTLTNHWEHDIPGKNQVCLAENALVPLLFHAKLFPEGDFLTFEGNKSLHPSPTIAPRESRPWNIIEDMSPLHSVNLLCHKLYQNCHHSMLNCHLRAIFWDLSGIYHHAPPQPWYPGTPDFDRSLKACCYCAASTLFAIKHTRTAIVPS
jgi:hypothetical protein